MPTARLRIAVVGGGVIGLACAWRLARGGAEVMLFDGAPEAREASWAAAGMLAPHHEIAVDASGACAGPTALWKLGAASLGRWPAFLDELPATQESVDFAARGGLLPILDHEDAREAEQRAAFLAAHGVRGQRLGADALRSVEPGLAAPEALLLPGAYIDPRLLTARLREACRRAGVELRYGCAVSALERAALRGADGERIAVDQVVLASGAWTPALASLAAIDLSGEPVKGQMLRLGAADGALRHFVHSRHAYAVPRRGGGIVVGSTMVCSGFDRGEDPAAVRRLADAARRLLPELAEAPLLESWTGLRPRLPGGLPCIDRVRDDLLVCTGHFRNGILLTPISAELVADLAFGRAPAMDLGPFRLAAVQAAARV